MKYVVAEAWGKFKHEIDELPCDEYDCMVHYLTAIKPALQRRANKRK